MRPTDGKIIEYKLSNQINVVQQRFVKPGRKAWKPIGQQVNELHDFEVICNNCGFKVGIGKYWIRGKMNFHFTDLLYLFKLGHIPGKVKKDTNIEWQGASGLNISPETNELNFECMCGNNWKEGVGILPLSINYKNFTFRDINE